MEEKISYGELSRDEKYWVPIRITRWHIHYANTITGEVRKIKKTELQKKEGKK